MNSFFCISVYLHYLQICGGNALNIRKTCPCNRCAGVHLFFLFLLQNIDCAYPLSYTVFIFNNFIISNKKLKISFGIKNDFLLKARRYLYCQVCISHLFIRVLMGQLTATRQHDLRVIYD